MLYTKNGSHSEPFLYTEGTMAGMEHPDVFSAGESGRVEETKYVQSRELPEQKAVQEREHIPAYDTMREYTIALDALPEYLRQVTKEMDTMRMADLPDREAYEKLREDLAQRYVQFQDVSQRMVALAEGETGVSGGARAMARILMREDRRDELEDAYRAAMEAVETFGRRKTDFTAEERPTPLELALPEYDKQVMKLMESLIALESNIDMLEKAGKLEETDRAEFREMLSAAYVQLDDLDRSAGDEVAGASRERKSLMQLFDTLKERLRRPGKTMAASSPLADLRITHQQVKAQYAAVQHTLTDEQRRLMRGKIAQMAVSLKQAEDEAGPLAYAMAQAVTPPPPPPEPPTQTTDIRSAVQLAVSRAAATASAIADAFRLAGPESRNR